jgi:hypothetical protein
VKKWKKIATIEAAGVIRGDVLTKRLIGNRRELAILRA